MKKQILGFMFVATAIFSMAAQASTNLLPGATVIVPGVTSGAEIDLAGGVIVDKIIPFKIVTPGGVLLFRGNLQNRIVKSASTGELHFYYRIRDTQAGLPGKVLAVTTQSFRVPPMIATSYRVDGLGTVAPRFATRSSNGVQVRFRFPFQGPAMFDAGESSKFFVIKTDGKHYNNLGYTRITLRSGHSVLMRTVQPLP